LCIFKFLQFPFREAAFHSELASRSETSLEKNGEPKRILHLAKNGLGLHESYELFRILRFLPSHDDSRWWVVSVTVEHIAQLTVWTAIS